MVLCFSFCQQCAVVSLFACFQDIPRVMREESGCAGGCSPGVRVSALCFFASQLIGCFNLGASHCLSTCAAVYDGLAVSTNWLVFGCFDGGVLRHRRQRLRERLPVGSCCCLSCVSAGGEAPGQHHHLQHGHQCLREGSPGNKSEFWVEVFFRRRLSLHKSQAFFDGMPLEFL